MIATVRSQRFDNYAVCDGVSQSQHALLTLTRALFVSKVDFCCSLLAGVSGHLLGRLQLVLSAAARLGFSAMHSKHISPTRCSATFSGCEPCSPERIQFHLSCVLTYRRLNGTAPSYLAESIRRVADLEGRRHLHSSASTSHSPVYTIQPVVKPVVRNRLSNPFDNRVNVCIHDTTGCQTRC